MKKLLLKITLLSIFFNSHLYYSAGLRGQFNKILTDYIVPSFIILMLIAVLAGLIRNWELIEDKNNDGTRQKGWANVGLIVGYVFGASVVITAVVGVLSAINIHI